MNQELWTAVDEYFVKQLIPSEDVFEAALQASAAAGLPNIAVSPSEGKFLHLLAQMHGAKRILEIGTLGGYSAIWLGRALPADGILISLELDPKHAEVARANLARAELTAKVSVRVGPALESLAIMSTEGHAPFDFIFIDADKQNNPGYFEYALKFSRPGSIILVDNVVRQGRVIEAESADSNIQGVRRLMEMVAAEKRVTATSLQTVGAKGYDGFMLVMVTG
ncbi:MAG: O-methyltransferase [Anaerolineae bacterium]